MADILRIARFGAGVDHVKLLRLRLEVVARELVLLVPVRRLDDELDLRVDALRVLNDEIHRVRDVWTIQPWHPLAEFSVEVGSSLRSFAEIVFGETPVQTVPFTWVMPRT
jgi:hypothetical protein